MQGRYRLSSLSPLPEIPSLKRLGMKAARSGAETESTLPELETAALADTILGGGRGLGQYNVKPDGSSALASQA